MKKALVYFLPVFSFLASCGGAEDSTENTEDKSFHTISGKVTGAEGEKVRLMVFQDGKENYIDSTVIVDGAYEVQTQTKELREYVLFVGTDVPVILFLDENSQNVTVSGSVPGFGENYSVTGCKQSEGVHTYMLFIKKHLDAEIALRNQLNTCNPSDTKMVSSIMAKLDSISYIQRDYAILEILKDTTSPVSWMMLGELIPASGFAKMDTNDLKYYQMVANGMRAKYPYTEYVTYIENDIQSIKSQIAQLNAPPSAAADINLEDVNGKKIALSSLRGKVVLIDFWASWCVPCRQANPEVVNLYGKYKDKGFTVYSVSLDENKDAWKQAIKDDNLSWPNHVSDLKGWQSSAAALYNVTSIPATFLLDKEGNIVSKNLRGAELEQKLLELLD